MLRNPCGLRPTAHKAGPVRARWRTQIFRFLPARGSAWRGEDCPAAPAGPRIALCATAASWELLTLEARSHDDIFERLAGPGTTRVGVYHVYPVGALSCPAQVRRAHSQKIIFLFALEAVRRPAFDDALAAHIRAHIQE